MIRAERETNEEEQVHRGTDRGNPEAERVRTEDGRGLPGSAYNAVSKYIEEAIEAVCPNNSREQNADEPKRQVRVFVVTQKSHADSHHDEIAEKYERSFQTRSLVVQWFVFGATILAFGAAAWYAYIANGQTQLIKVSADAAKSAAETASKQLESADRPWMKITKAFPLSGLSFTHYPSKSAQTKKGTVEMPILVVASNVGKSVARDVSLQGAMVNAVDAVSDIRRAESDICFGRSPGDKTDSVNVFPGDDTGNTLWFPGAADISRLSFAEGNVEIWFMGCVEYTIPVTSARKHSLFMFALTRRERTRTFGDEFFQIGVNMPQASVFLQAAGVDSFGVD